MHVIFVSAIDPPKAKPSGTKSYVLNIINMLIEKGMQASLIGVSHQPSQPFNPEYSFIPVVKDKKISSYKFLFNLLIHVLFQRIPKDGIIHVQRPEDALPFLLFHKKNPKVYTVHGNNFKNMNVLKHGKLISSIIDFIDDFAIQRVNKVIVVDEKTKHYYVKKFPWLHAKINVIPVGIDTDIFRPRNKNALREKYNFDRDKNIVLYVGRYNKEKGLDLLIRSFRWVQKEMTDCKLVLVGEGPEKQNLRKLAEGTKGVVFMDPLPHEKIPEILNCANVFALCSLYEGMPTVVLESLACGIPVVSTDVGDVHKVVRDGKTGYIVKTRTEEEISTKLIKVLSNSDKFKENCVEIAKEYSWDKIAEKIIGVYHEVQAKN